jgi:hypothetical protein
MRHLKMSAGKAAPVGHPLWFGRVSVLQGEHNGVFYPAAAPAACVKQGMAIGYDTDHFGKAPCRP